MVPALPINDYYGYNAMGYVSGFCFGVACPLSGVEGAG